MTDEMTENDIDSLNSDDTSNKNGEADNDKAPKKKKSNEVEQLEKLGESKIATALNALENAIGRMRGEVSFTMNAFNGNVNKVQELANKTNESISQNCENLNKLLSEYNECSETFKDHTRVLSLVPDKTKDTLEKLVPDIGKQVEQIHKKRMEEISSTLTGLKDAIGDECKSHQESLKVLLSDFQKQLNDNIVTTIDVKVKEIAEHTKKEVSAVTANHGTKFLRNLAISIILATLAGALSGWYINQYFPSFVRIGKDANVTINRSHVEIWKAGINNESESLKN